MDGPVIHLPLVIDEYLNTLMMIDDTLMVRDREYSTS